jgi:hypothetical protein
MAAAVNCIFYVHCDQQAVLDNKETIFHGSVLLKLDTQIDWEPAAARAGDHLRVSLPSVEFDVNALDQDARAFVDRLSGKE